MRVDQQEVEDVPEIKVAKRKLTDILNDISESSRPYPKLKYAERPVEFNLSDHLREDPRQLFGQFITDFDFEELAFNTNQNAALKHPQMASQYDHPRCWKDTNGAELKIWLGILIYMGALPHITQNIESYWNTDPRKDISPSVTQYMGASRWLQIQRYLKPSDLQYEQEWNMEGPDWWKKVYPLWGRFLIRCRKVVKATRDCSIDELLVPFHGRSKHTMEISSKAAGKGYKIYALNIPGGFLVDMRITSGVFKIADVDSQPGERLTSTMIKDMMTLLPQCPPNEGYVVWLDNFFVTRDLLIGLRKLGIGAAGTAKGGSGVPQTHIELREAASKKRDWGLIVTEEVPEMEIIKHSNCRKGGPHKPDVKRCPPRGCVWIEKRPMKDGVPVLAAAWVDKAVVNFMSTVHSHEDFRTGGYWKPRCKRKEIKVFNAKDVQSIDGEDSLRIPCPYHEYNQRMGFTDQHAQLTASYTVQHTLFRSWWPLYFQIINAALSNAWVVSRKLGGKLNHREFQLKISEQLREEGTQQLRILHLQGSNECVKPWKWPPAPSGGLPEDIRHTPTKIKRSYCRVCARERKTGLIGNRRALQELDRNQGTPRKRPKQTTWACDVCVVPLCNNEWCWGRFHKGRPSGKWKG